MVDIEKIEKRAVRSFYDDGLFEVAFGLILLLLGGYFFLETVLPEGSGLAKALSGLFVLVIVSAGFIVGHVLRFLKRRITYPRSGFVVLKKKADPKRRALAAVAGAVIGASLAALYALSPTLRTLLPAVNGVLFGVALLLVANKIGIVRFFILAAVSAVAGVAVTAAGYGDTKGVGLYYALFGAAVMVSGLITLVVYLNRSPRPEPGAPEGPDAH